MSEHAGTGSPASPERSGGARQPPLERRGARSSRSTPPNLPADRLLPWLVRVLWVALPFTVGPALGDALAAASRSVQLVATAGLWLGWAAGMIATAVALPVSLTVLRVTAPAVVVATIAAAAGGHASPVAIGWALVTAGWVFSPTVGAICVNGPAYPNERRFLLRAPGAVLFGPLAVAWALSVAGIASGPLLLAAKQWVLGGLLTAIGFPVAFVLLRAIHDLSRRWLVFVPAGIVLHDPLTVIDPFLVARQHLARIGAGHAGTDAVDLTQNAPGLALEVDSKEELTLAVVRPGRRLGASVKTHRFLLTPTRPGALLAEARRRRLPVG